MFKKFAKNYLDALKESINGLPLDRLEEVTDMLKNAYREGRHIFVMGNGGSAATASHFVCDFAKGCGVEGKKRFRVIGLTDNIPIITAVSNDISYDDIFSAQLEALIEKDDLILVFTGSGNSKNILKAVEYANSIGAKTVAFTGFEGGKVKEIAHKTLIVPSDNMERIEDIHLILEHLIHLYMLEEIREGQLS